MKQPEEQIEYLPVGSIMPDPNQPRERIPEEHVSGLATSARRAWQVLVPIRVRLDKALGQRVNVAGHCRWMAASCRHGNRAGHLLE